MNYILSSVSAVKYLEERKQWSNFKKKKFQCFNMQLIPDTAKQSTSFSWLSEQQLFVYAEQHLYIIVILEIENLHKTRSHYP